jgi:hypothetical protein
MLNERLRAFWALVEAKAQELQKMQASGELGRLQGAEHATLGAAWITSLEPKWDDKEGRGGIVCGVFNFSLVGRRLIEKSHRLSTASEVESFMNSSRREYARLKSEEDLRNGKTHVVAIEAQAPTAVKK